MPFAMGDYLQSVVIHGKVYIGGGYGGYSSGSKYIVLEYDSALEKWAKLPPYRACNSAMVAIDDKLVLVSGYEHNHRTKEVGVWGDENKQWTHPYPEMKIGRSSPSAFVYSDWLVVAGGRGDTTEGRLSSVEVMNITDEQWQIISPMPVSWARMKAVVVDDTCYFMGGGVGKVHHTYDVYSVSLPTFISQLDSNSQTDEAMWKRETTLPTSLSSPLAASGSLLALGGWNKDRIISSSILLYKPDSREWVTAGDMPTPRHNFTSAVMDGKILVAGGDNDDKYLKTVDLATVTAP